MAPAVLSLAERRQQQIDHDDERTAHLVDRVKRFLHRRRSNDELQGPRRRGPGTVRRLRHRRDPRVGRRGVRLPHRRRVLDGRRRPAARRGPAPSLGRHAVPRDRLPLRRDDRHARRRRGIDAAVDRRRQAPPQRRRAGRRVRREALRARSGAVLPDAQGRAAARHAAGLRGLDHRRTPRRGRRPAPTPRSSRGTTRTAWSRSTRWPPGRSTTCSRTPTSNDVIVNPLVNDGYPSIGCATCTRRVAPGEDPRAGRWAGLDKTECGLHA